MTRKLNELLVDLRNFGRDLDRLPPGPWQVDRSGRVTDARGKLIAHVQAHGRVLDRQAIAEAMVLGWSAKDLAAEAAAAIERLSVALNRAKRGKTDA